MIALSAIMKEMVTDAENSTKAKIASDLKNEMSQFIKTIGEK